MLHTWILIKHRYVNVSSQLWRMCYPCLYFHCTCLWVNILVETWHLQKQKSSWESGKNNLDRNGEDGQSLVSILVGILFWVQLFWYPFLWECIMWFYFCRMCNIFMLSIFISLLATACHHARQVMLLLEIITRNAKKFLTLNQNWVERSLTRSESHNCRKLFFSQNRKKISIKSQA